MVGDPHAYALPLPLRTTRDCNFSFSGLKTAVVRTLQRLDPSQLPAGGGQARITHVNVSVSLSEQQVRDMAASFQVSYVV